MTTFLIFFIWWAIGTALLFSPSFFKEAKERIAILTFSKNKSYAVLILLLISVAIFPLPMLAPFAWAWDKIKELIFKITLRIWARRIAKMAKGKDGALSDRLKEIADKMKGGVK